MDAPRGTSGGALQLHEQRLDRGVEPDATGGACHLGVWRLADRRSGVPCHPIAFLAHAWRQRGIRRLAQRVADLQRPAGSGRVAADEARCGDRDRCAGEHAGIAHAASDGDALATAVLDEWFTERFFTWVPDAILQFSAVGEAGESAPTHVLVIMLVAVVFNGVVGPVVEELYFRGYLLPRIDRYGRGAPVLNTVLFSIYHLWTPWQNPARIVGFLPIAWMGWRTRSIQLTIATHVSINLVFLLGMLALLGGAA